jgi:gamma-glutamyltranspeptidase/glutathione hydrolase
VVLTFAETHLNRWPLIAAAICAAAQIAAGASSTVDDLPPELRAPEAHSDLGMVATGSPEATKAAVNILEAGGNAIDAAVAASLVLGVVDSDASGLGGMTSMVIHLAHGRTFAVDATSNAPLVIDIERFRSFKASGRTFGYETIGVPTTLAALEYVRRRYGTMDLASLLEPAIEAAEKGYALSKIQIIWTEQYYDNIMKSQDYLRFLAMEDGSTIGKPGDRQCQPDLANTLRRIATHGAADFFFGGIAREIDADMIRGGGFVRRSDLARVRVREVEPVHTTYRGLDVYSFPKPGGGPGVVAALNVLENFPQEILGEASAQRHHLLIEIFRIAAADAVNASNPQTTFSVEPLSKRHARDRSALIRPGHVIPEEMLAVSIPPECLPATESTTQVSVADAQGNVVSLTQTLSRSFGAKIATPGLGFPYNSFLESYNADKPQCPGYLKPSSPTTNDMAPTIVLENGMLFAALGSPGSRAIPQLVVQVLSNVVDRGMNIRDAVTAPRVMWTGIDTNQPYFELAGPVTEDYVDVLEKAGYSIVTPLPYPPPPGRLMANYGGVNAITYDPETGSYSGVGDPRRYGSALGPRVVATTESAH